MLAAAEDAEAAAARLARDCRRQMLIGFTPGLTVIAARLVHELRRQRPRLEMRLRETPARMLDGAISSGTVDIVITSPAPTTPDIAIAPVLRVPLVGLISENHALARQEALTWAQLAAATAVGPWWPKPPPDTARRHARDREHAPGAPSPEGIDEAWPSIQAGAAVAVIPRFLVKDYAIEGVISVPLVTPAHTVVVVTHRHDDARPLVCAVGDLIAKQRFDQW